tara:strand:+ start:1621 stop:1764 length:144 start_codon:yes stop_codon:yes gene_type:complete
MAKKAATYKREPIKKKTSQGGNKAMIKLSSMNKNKKSSYKVYRGQGR